MSGLIKSIKKKVRKVFSFVKKTWARIKKSKILKAIAIAVAIYFTAGAVAGMMGTTASTAGLAGQAAVAGTPAFAPAVATVADAAVLGGSGLATSGGIGSALATFGSNVKTIGTGLKGAFEGMTAAQASLIQTGASFAQDRLKAKAEQDAIKKEGRLREEANSTQLNIRERLSPFAGRGVAPRPDATTLGASARKFYDPTTDTYVGVS